VYPLIGSINIQVEYNAIQNLTSNVFLSLFYHRIELVPVNMID